MFSVQFLHGSRLLLKLSNLFPLFIKGTFRYLSNKCNDDKQSIPPHSYKTISCGLFNYKFDRCVYMDEAMLEKEHHIWIMYFVGFIHDY